MQLKWFRIIILVESAVRPSICITDFVTFVCLHRMGMASVGGTILLFHFMQRAGFIGYLYSTPHVCIFGAIM